LVSPKVIGIANVISHGNNKKERPVFEF